MNTFSIMTVVFDTWNRITVICVCLESFKQTADLSNLQVFSRRRKLFIVEHCKTTLPRKRYYLIIF